MGEAEVVQIQAVEEEAQIQMAEAGVDYQRTVAKVQRSQPQSIQEVQRVQEGHPCWLEDSQRRSQEQSIRNIHC